MQGKHQFKCIQVPAVSNKIHYSKLLFAGYQSLFQSTLIVQLPIKGEIQYDIIEVVVKRKSNSFYIQGTLCILNCDCFIYQRSTSLTWYQSYAGRKTFAKCLL